MKRDYFKYILYVSFVFLLIALIKSNYLVIPEIVHPLYLMASILFLFLGFLIMGIYWRVMLAQSEINVSFQQSIASIGLSIFAKYIPGKIWVLLGRAAYISEKCSASKAITTSISFQAQIISLWVGMLLGGIGLAFSGGLDKFNYGLLMILVWLGFTLMIFTPYFNKILKDGVRRWLKKEIDLPVFSFKDALRLLPYFFLNWGLWCAAFLLLAQSLTHQNISEITGLAFALGGTLGILALIVPGGLGIREGIIAWYLILTGMDKPTAVTISVASRLWFLIGEVFIFSLAAYFHRRAVKGSPE